MDIVNCGIRNDEVNAIIKPFVRNKDFKDIEEMTNKLDDELLPRIRNYVYWSFFNQLSTDLIENSFYSHPSIIPTLRKIHDIDFFMKIDGKIIPFDLKITHISDEFFNLYSEGLEKANKEGNEDSPDSFIIKNDINEEKNIKKIYKEFKKEFDLPNYGDLTKFELVDNLKKKNNKSINDKLNEIYDFRYNMIKEISSDTTPLEWWNYKYQGERLFSNNNRFFVFLAHERDFRDGKDLKKNIKSISDSLTDKLDHLSLEDIHKINYVYEKDNKSSSNYTVNCISILVTKE